MSLSLRLAGRLGPPVWREGGEHTEERRDERREVKREERRKKQRDSEGEDQDMDDGSKVRRSII